MWHAKHDTAGGEKLDGLSEKKDIKTNFCFMRTIHFHVPKKKQGNVNRFRIVFHTAENTQVSFGNNLSTKECSLINL